MPQRRRRPVAPCFVASLAVAAAASVASAQTSLTGSSIVLKSNGSATLASNGYVGTYLTIPTGGATVNFTVTATASAGATAAPHMNLVIGDTASGFAVNSTSATSYTTPNVTLPAGTYFVRNERDYSGNVGVSRSFTVNNLAVSTVAGGAATFSNTSSNTNALTAANTYIDNFRKGLATVAVKGPGNIPLLAGTSIQADLARHAFNFGTEVPGNTPSDVNNYLGNNGTTLQTNYQAKLNQNFNAIVPGNAGKWQNNEFTRDVVTMSGVDTVLNYAQSHNMRARIHNLIWGKNSFNGQQPSWVLNSSNNGLLDLALAGNAAAAAELRGEITERIQYYLNATRAPKFVELDVYNESFHEPEYRTALGFDSVDGIASIHNEAAAAAAAAGASVKMFTNEYNVFQDGGDAFANWYVNEIQSIRNAGGNVGGIGAQYYPNTTIGTANNQHNAARMYAVMQNLGVQGLPVALTEFGVKAGGEAIAPQVLEESMRLTFGTPNATGFLMWGFWAGEGLFAPGSPLYDASWNITDNGRKWQDLLGIADFDGNLSNGWDTNVATLVDAAGAINFNGFFGDYYLRGQTSGAYDMTLVKGTGSYNVAMTAPPTWSLWNGSNSGNWSAAGNWTSGGVAGAAGQTAYFGPAGAARAVNVDSPRTVGMLAFNSSGGAYSLNGASAITLQGFANAAGNRAAIYVAAGNHVINAPLTLLNDTTIMVASSADSLTVTNLETSASAITKAGAGTLAINRIRAAALNVDAGVVRVLPGGASAGTNVVADLEIAASAALDLTDNDLIVDYTGVSPELQIRQWVRDGRASGGTHGIVTTLGTPADDKVLAVIDNAEWGKASFNGITIDTSSVVGKYTYFGDANLDGMVTGDDYLAVDAGLGTGTSWLDGDFNLDNVVTGDDYLAVDANLGKGTATPLTWAALKDEMAALHASMFGEPYLEKLADVEANGFATAVPEPAAFSLVGLAAGAVAGRSRKHRGRAGFLD